MPIDPKTGREYPYTEEGIQQYEEDTSGAQSPPFTMKGFPVHAGTSPAKQHAKSFNVKGSSGVPVGQDFEKYAKNVHEQKFDKFQTQRKAGKQFVKDLKTKGDLVSKKPTSKLSKVTQFVTKHAPKVLKALNPLAEAKVTYDVFKHGIENIKEGKAKIPKGYYEKGGEGYKKRDYSKKK